MESSTSATISQIQNELGQKDELIAALVQELEKAVDQLDRFERSGAERSHSDLPNPLHQSNRHSFESPAAANDNVRQMADEWADARPTDSLSRIEAELAAVHEMLRTLRLDAPRAAESSILSSCFQSLRQEEPAHECDDVVNKTLDESSVSWDAIKTDLLKLDSASWTSSDQQDESELLKLMAETPTPAEVNFQSASLDELKTAVVERDSYIIQLNRLFRTRNTLSLPTDWAELGKVSSEMQIRVESLIEHLDVQVRLGEVEMSLERARLARERSQIQSDREEIEKHMKRLGLSSLADLDNISAASGTANDRRWMRFLGPSTK